MTWWQENYLKNTDPSWQKSIGHQLLSFTNKQYGRNLIVLLWAWQTVRKESCCWWFEAVWTPFVTSLKCCKCWGNTVAYYLPYCVSACQHKLISGYVYGDWSIFEYFQWQVIPYSIWTRENNIFVLSNAVSDRIFEMMYCICYYPYGEQHIVWWYCMHSFLPPDEKSAFVNYMHVIKMV